MTSEQPWSPVIPTYDRETLTKAFPDYLREPILKWMGSITSDNYGYAQTGFFLDFQNAAHIYIGFTSGTHYSWTKSVQPKLRQLDDTTFTNLIDYRLSTQYVSRFPHPLEATLSQGGSAWTVVEWKSRHARLSERVPEGVRNSLAASLSAKDSASLKLQEAWVDAYGPNPRPSVAYSHAVVAVETAALSVIPTSVAEPTLANTFSILEAEAPKWELVFRESEKAPGGKTLALMLRTLWRGHASRHGRQDYADATLEEARAAVILAATLVQWFNTGVVRPL